MRGGSALYRHFDKDGFLLYVGVSLSAINRLAQHRDNAEWFDRIIRVEMEWHPTREDAEKAEKEAIVKERPLFNKTHRDKAEIMTLPIKFDWEAAAELLGLHPVYDGDLESVLYTRCLHRCMLASLERNFTECYKNAHDTKMKVLNARLDRPHKANMAEHEKLNNKISGLNSEKETEASEACSAANEQEPERTSEERDS